jgi:hypothetical protein
MHSVTHAWIGGSGLTLRCLHVIMSAGKDVDKTCLEVQYVSSLIVSMILGHLSAPFSLFAK